MRKENSRSLPSALLAESYNLFSDGRFKEAQGLLEEAHSQDFDNQEIQSALRAAGFWLQRLEFLDTVEGLGFKGDYLLKQWNHYFRNYRNNFRHSLENGSLKIKRWVYNSALDFYRKQAAETSDPFFLFKASRCYKALGRYEDSKKILETAFSWSGKNIPSPFLAELADIYALMGESEPAKILMREALYIDASAVDTDNIEAPVFKKLFNKVASVIDREDPLFNDWVAVYGTVWEVFDVKRELTPAEYGKLKQDIYSLKSELRENSSSANLPKLINHYLWLIDYYKAAGAGRSAIDEALINIKLLSPDIYKHFME